MVDGTASHGQNNVCRPLPERSRPNHIPDSTGRNPPEFIFTYDHDPERTAKTNSQRCIKTRRVL
jgi:hypothetical protein